MRAPSRGFLTVAVEQQRGVLLADVGDGPHQWDAVAQLALVLVVVPLEHGLAYLVAELLLQLARRHHAVNQHVCDTQHTQHTRTHKI